MVEEHPIQGLMQTAMENLKEMVDVNTIVGEPVETPNGSVVIPISKVGFGFAAGGSEYVPGAWEEEHAFKNSLNNDKPFGGGSGGGVSITPVAFLVVSHTDVKLLPLDSETHIYERLIDLAPQAIEKIQNAFKGRNKDNNDIDNTRIHQ